MVMDGASISPSFPNHHPTSINAPAVNTMRRYPSQEKHETTSIPCRAAPLWHRAPWARIVISHPPEIWNEPLCLRVPQSPGHSGGSENDQETLRKGPQHSEI